MSALTDLTEDEQEEAINLFLAKKKEEERECEYSFKQKQYAERFYDLLNVPYSDKIVIVSSALAKTIIHSEIAILDISSDFIIHSYSTESGRHKNGDRSSRLDKVNRSGRDYDLGPIRHNRINEGNNYHYFFVNKVYTCPFCNENHCSGSRTKNKAMSDICDGYYMPREYVTLPFIHKIFKYPYTELSKPSEISTDDFFTEGTAFRRCDKCIKISRKDHLKDYKSHDRYGNDDKARRALYEAIYPPAMKGTKKYFAEKRVKKVSNKRPLTKSERNFFSMILGAAKLKQLTK